MRTTFMLAGAVTLSFFLAGCAGMVVAPVNMPPAFIYADHTVPLDTNFQNTQIAGLRQGEASVQNILGLISFGDSGVKEAAADGEISRIHHADYRFVNVLGIWSKYTTIVYGE